MGHLLVIPPAGELLTIEDAASHLRIDLEDLEPTETAQLWSWIVAARRNIEQRLSVALVQQSWRLTLDAFPAGAAPITLPRPPLLSVTAVEYLDTAGATQTLDSSAFVLDVESRPGRIGPLAGTVWPRSAGQIASVRVTYVAGLDINNDELAEMLADLRSVMLLMVGDFYRNRESQVGDTLNDNKTVSALLDAHYRYWNG